MKRKININNLKKSERTILVFLNSKKFSSALKISRVLDQDKSYINKIINGLIDKGLVARLENQKPYEYYLEVTIE